VPRGKPPPTGPFSKTNKDVLKPAATSASPLSNNQALTGSRHHPLARSFMTRR
jgi:hypothetical protein